MEHIEEGKPVPPNYEDDNRLIRTSEEDNPNIGERILVILSYVLVIISFPVAVFFCLVIVREYERAVIFRLGRLRKGGARGPGLFFVLPCIDDWVRVDMRVNSFEVPPQEILTKDSVTISVDAVVYFRLNEPLKAVIQVENAYASTKLLAQTTLRNISGSKMLIELLTSKEELSHMIEAILEKATAPWGVKVDRVEIKDVRLPSALQRAMASEAEAIREAKAKIAAAEGELNASRALKEASDIMAQNPIALQLRYLQTLVTISSERNSTIIFPFPIELMNLGAELMGGSTRRQVEPPPTESTTVASVLQSDSQSL